MPGTGSIPNHWFYTKALDKFNAVFNLNGQNNENQHEVLTQYYWVHIWANKVRVLKMHEINVSQDASSTLAKYTF